MIAGIARILSWRSQRSEIRDSGSDRCDLKSHTRTILIDLDDPNNWEVWKTPSSCRFWNIFLTQNFLFFVSLLWSSLFFFFLTLMTASMPRAPVGGSRGYLKYPAKTLLFLVPCPRGLLWFIRRSYENQSIAPITGIASTKTGLSLRSQRLYENQA